MAIIEGAPGIIYPLAAEALEQVDDRRRTPPTDYSLLAPSQESPVPEAFPLSEIVRETEIDPASLGIPEELRPRRIVQVEMHDPQLDALDPDLVWATRTWIDHLSVYVRWRKDHGRYTRLPGVAGGTYMDSTGQYVNGRAKKHWGDQATRERLLDDLGSEGVRAWIDTIPTGRALEILTNIGRISTIYSNKGKYLGTMDEHGRAMLAAAPDSVGIRERFSDEALTFVRIAEQNGGTLAGQRIASYGSGSATGPMKGAQVIRRNNPNAKDPELMHYDIDPNAIKAANELARGDMQFEGKISQHVKNLLNPVTMALEGVKLWLTRRRPDISEAEGFWEYIDRDQLNAIFARRGVRVPKDPEVRFLKMMYKATKRHVMFSQMRDDRPNPEFLDAFGWGLVVTRGEKEVLSDIKKAGIPLDQVEVRRLGSGIYTRYIIDKKAGMSRSERLMARAKGFLGKVAGAASAANEQQTGVADAASQPYDAFATFNVPGAPDLNELAGLSR